MAERAATMAGDLDGVTSKAGTMNGAKEMRGARAMLKFVDCDGGVGEHHRLSEHALLERVGAAGCRAQYYTELDELCVVL